MTSLDFDRRTILAGMTMASALPFLSGCQGRSDDDPQSPPDQPPDCRPPASNGDVTWAPDVAHPVSWGAVDVGPHMGAPRNMMIYYPAARRFGPADLDVVVPADRSPNLGGGTIGAMQRVGRPRSTPILQICGRRWPVVLFLHGNVPDDVKPTHYRMWRDLPSTLARAGFIVLVPSHGASPAPTDADVAAALRDVAWVRTQWASAAWVDPGPHVSFAAHSNGCYTALLAAREQSATASLTFLGANRLGESERNYFRILEELRASQFLMFVENNSIENQFTGWLSGSGTRPRTYLAGYRGGHFDYLPDVRYFGQPRGPCTLLGRIASDLVTLFISTSQGGFNQIAPELNRPTVPLSAAQQRYADGYMRSLSEAACAPGCRINLQWKVSGAQGMRTIGPTGGAPAACVQG